MNEIIKRDILSILGEAIEIIQHDEIYKLRELSDHVIHNASIFQDNDSITIAVIIYAISKVENPSNRQKISQRLSSAMDLLQEGELEKYREEVRALLSDITEQGAKAKLYLSEVLERAQIKKASRMYEHGISLGQVADALGISIWDLMEYVGKTTIPDSFGDISDVRARIRFTRELLR